MTASNVVNVTLSQSSIMTNRLLRPAQHSLTIQVNCGVPKQSRLIWAQANDTISGYLPRSRIVHNERTHWVLTNSEHHLRYLMLDNELKTFANYSSIIPTITASDASLAKVSSLDGSYAEAILNDRYSKLSVSFTNKTGVVLIDLLADSYITPMT